MFNSLIYLILRFIFIWNTITYAKKISFTVLLNFCVNRGIGGIISLCMKVRFIHKGTIQKSFMQRFEAVNANTIRYLFIITLNFYSHCIHLYLIFICILLRVNLILITLSEHHKNCILYRFLFLHQELITLHWHKHVSFRWRLFVF